MGSKRRVPFGERVVDQPGVYLKQCMEQLRAITKERDGLLAEVERLTEHSAKMAAALMQVYERDALKDTD